MLKVAVLLLGVATAVQNPNREGLPGWANEANTPYSKVYDPKLITGGKMAFVNQEGVCMETEIDLSHRNTARSLFNDLIEGDCKSRGFEVEDGTEETKVGAPYWLGKDPLIFKWKAYVPSEIQEAKWNKEITDAQEIQEKLEKELKEKMDALPADVRATVEKMQRNEPLTAQDKKSLEKLEKIEMERIQQASKKVKEGIKPAAAAQKGTKRRSRRGKSRRARRSGKEAETETQK